MKGVRRPAESIQAFDGTIFGIIVIVVGWVRVTISPFPLL